MTIFRFSAALALASLSGCSENLPAPDTELGRILRIKELDAAKSALVTYLNAGITDRERLRREFADAGFRSVSRSDDRGRHCELFEWQGRQRWKPFGFMIRASICENDQVNVGFWRNLP